MALDLPKRSSRIPTRQDRLDEVALRASPAVDSSKDARMRPERLGASLPEEERISAPLGPAFSFPTATVQTGKPFEASGRVTLRLVPDSVIKRSAF